MEQSRQTRASTATSDQLIFSKAAPAHASSPAAAARLRRSRSSARRPAGPRRRPAAAPPPRAVGGGAWAEEAEAATAGAAGVAVPDDGGNPQGRGVLIVRAWLTEGAYGAVTGAEGGCGCAACALGGPPPPPPPPGARSGWRWWLGGRAASPASPCGQDPSRRRLPRASGQERGMPVVMVTRRSRDGHVTAGRSAALRLRSPAAAAADAPRPFLIDSMRQLEHSRVSWAAPRAGPAMVARKCGPAGPYRGRGPAWADNESSWAVLPENPA